MSNELLEEESEEEENAERWLLTYADMITLLMAFFIMMYSMSQVDLSEFHALAASVRTEFVGTELAPHTDLLHVNPGVDSSLGIFHGTRFGLRKTVETGLNKALSASGLCKHVKLLEIDGNLVIRLLDDHVLFTSGSAALTPDSRQLLSRIAHILRALPYTIRIEGHTDTVPINTPQFPSNWELSTRRATNVVLYLMREQNVSPDRLSAVGYGETKPVAPNDTAKGRQQNRRIDIVLLTQVAETPTVSTEALVKVSQAAGEVGDGQHSSIVPPVNIVGGR